MKQRQLWILKNYPYIIILGMMCATGIAALGGESGFCALLFNSMAVLSVLFVVGMSIMTIKYLKKETVPRELLNICLEIKQYQENVYIVLILGAFLGIITVVLLPLTIVSAVVWVSMMFQSGMLGIVGAYGLYKEDRITKEHYLKMIFSQFIPIFHMRYVLVLMDVVSGSRDDEDKKYSSQMKVQEAVKIPIFKQELRLLEFYLYFVAVYSVLFTFFLPKWDADADMELVLFVIVTPILIVLYVTLMVHGLKYFKSLRSCESGWLIKQNCRIKLVLLPAICVCICCGCIIYQSNTFITVWAGVSVLTTVVISGKIGNTAVNKLFASGKIQKGRKCLLSVLQYILFADMITAVHMCRLEDA